MPPTDGSSRAPRGARGALCASLIGGALLGALAVAADAGAEDVSKASALVFESDDAPEAAEQFTSVVRAAARRQLQGTDVADGQPVSLFTAAFKCQARPEEGCLKKIGDKLKVDRLVYGSLNHRAPNSPEILAEAHLWVRGKGDSHARLAYPQDLPRPALEAAVGRLFEKLVTPHPQSTIEVRTVDVPGAYVQLESGARETLEKGAALADFGPGAHTIEVVAAGYERAKVSIDVESDLDMVVVVPLKRGGAAGVAGTEDGGVTGGGKDAGIRPILAWSAIGVGALAAGLSIYEITRYSHWSDVRENTFDHPYSRASVCNQLSKIDASHLKQPSVYSANDFCDSFGNAQTASVVAIFSGLAGAGLLATGIVLVTSPPHESSGGKSAASLPKLQLLPHVGLGRGGLDARYTFE